VLLRLLLDSLPWRSSRYVVPSWIRNDFANSMYVHIRLQIPPVYTQLYSCWGRRKKYVYWQVAGAIHQMTCHLSCCMHVSSIHEELLHANGDQGIYSLFSALSDKSEYFDCETIRFILFSSYHVCLHCTVPLLVRRR
jgi:hypothetical protein